MCIQIYIICTHNTNMTKRREFLSTIGGSMFIMSTTGCLSIDGKNGLVIKNTESKRTPIGNIKIITTVKNMDSESSKEGELIAHVNISNQETTIKSKNIQAYPMEEKIYDLIVSPNTAHRISNSDYEYDVWIE